MLAQMEVIPGRPDLNVRKMESIIKQAKKNGIQLLIFPEMCVSGLLLGDKYLSDSYCESLMEYNKIFEQHSQGIAIIYGNIYIKPKKMDTATADNGASKFHKFNAVYAFQDGKPVKKRKESQLIPQGVHVKSILSNSPIFDDTKYFTSLISPTMTIQDFLTEINQPFIFNFEGLGEYPIGIEIGEIPFNNLCISGLETINLTRILIENGALMIVNISCSPFNSNKNIHRDARIENIYEGIRDKFVPYMFLNCVGAQNIGKNIITFNGGTAVYNSKGKLVKFAGESFVETNLEINLKEINEFAELKELNELPGTKNSKDRIKEKFKAICCGVKHMNNIAVRQFPWIIGLSGGVDSALVAAICTYVCGPENVLAVNLPTKHNTEKTRNIAKKIAENLKIPYLVIPIQDMVAVNNKVIEDANFNDEIKPLTGLLYENIQAKIRGAGILSNLAAKYGGMFTNNGNKVEIALGYSTLYGDMGGAIAPIGDLTKAEVYGMSRYVNELFKREIIPEQLLPDELFRFEGDKIVPSAELRDNQVDPMKYGYHCAIIEKIIGEPRYSIEDICKLYLEGVLPEKLGISRELFERYELGSPQVFIDDIEWIFRMVQIAVYKRIQSPPIIALGDSAYGNFIKEAQMLVMFTNEYLRLKEQIISKKNA